MKKFSYFISEANKSRSSFNAKRLGLVGDGHGGWYGKKTGEFIAKTDNKNRDGLKFYNQNQLVGEKDPPQKKVYNKANTQSSLEKPNIPNRTEEYYTSEKILREKYISGQIFLEGQWVQNVNNGLVGKIIRRGTNYLICVTEDDQMFKPWIHDVVEWTNVSGVPADQRLIGTDAYRNYAAKMAGSEGIRNFINKYKAKRVNKK